MGANADLILHARIVINILSRAVLLELKWTQDIDDIGQHGLDLCT